MEGAGRGMGAGDLSREARFPKARPGRSGEFHRHRIKTLHECAALDLAVWTTGSAGFLDLRGALTGGLSPIQDTPYGSVAQHDVDLYLLDAADGSYRGRLCDFGQCPKKGKRECLAPGCGAQPFLRQFAGWSFNPERFARDPKVTLFDRASGFLVHPPEIDPEATSPVRRGNIITEVTDDDVPF
jgi:hypothetical protein